MNRVLPMAPLRQRQELVKDEAHLAFIRRLPCCCTLIEGERVEPHHLLRVPTEERGASRKSGDEWSLPLAGHVHDDLHHCGLDERLFLARYGVYGPGLAALLYRLSGDEVACRRAIFEVRDAHDQDRMDA